MKTKFVNESIDDILKPIKINEGMGFKSSYQIIAQDAQDLIKHGHNKNKIANFISNELGDKTVYKDILNDLDTLDDLDEFEFNRNLEKIVFKHKMQIQESLIGIGSSLDLNSINKYNTKIREYFNYILNYFLNDMEPTQATEFLEDVEDDVEEKYTEGFNAAQTISDLEKQQFTY